MTKLKLKILTKTSFRILTKIQLCGLNQTSQQILTKVYLQNLAWPSTLKSWSNLMLKVWTNLRFQFCNKLLPKWSSSSTSATVTISTSFELPSSHARVTSIKFTDGSESVSGGESLTRIGLGSDKNGRSSTTEVSKWKYSWQSHSPDRYFFCHLQSQI